MNSLTILSPAQALGAVPAVKGETPVAARKDAGDTGLRGICAEARVMTAFGQVPAKLLRPRDELRTVEGDLVLLGRVRPLSFEAETLDRFACARAVRFEPGSIGPNRPDRPFEVSPGLMIEGHPEHHGDQPVSALCWIGLPGVSHAGTAETRYFMLELARPATLLVEGVAFLA